MVVRKYDNYFPEESYKNCNNDAYRGICLMDLYQDSITYNSFIVGSSRSDFYYVEEWKKVTLRANTRCNSCIFGRTLRKQYC